MIEKIYFITTNQYKFDQFLLVAKKYKLNNYKFEQLAGEIIEIQAEDNEQVAKFSSKWASKKYNLPIIKEDVGFYIERLKGFPGPYLSQVENQLETSGFLQLLNNSENRNAYWQYSIAICFPNQKPVVFSTIQKGEIAAAAKGKSGWHTDKLFIQDGQEKTISELLDANNYHRDNRHYEKLLEYLRNKTNCAPSQ